MIFYKEVVHTKPSTKPVCPYCAGTQFKPDHFLPLRYDFDIWFLFFILACSFTVLILVNAGEVLQNIIAVWEPCWKISLFGPTEAIAAFLWIASAALSFGCCTLLIKLKYWSVGSSVQSKKCMKCYNPVLVITCEEDRCNDEVYEATDESLSHRLLANSDSSGPDGM